MKIKTKIPQLIKEFDCIIEEAPVDFLGTGSDSKLARKQEDEWYEYVSEFREKLAELIEKTKNE